MLRTGLRLRFEKGVNPELRKRILDFSRWLRLLFVFPIRVPVYVKSSPRIRSLTGEYVCGTFFAPYDKLVEPYIRIATGDYNELVDEIGEEDAQRSILNALAHEIVHYNQWINDKSLNERGPRLRASRLVMKYWEQTRKLD